MMKLVFRLRFFSLLFLCSFGCQKEKFEQSNNLLPNVQAEERAVLNPPPPAGFYAIKYELHPNMSILNYTIKARKNSFWNLYSTRKTSWGAVLINNIQTYRSSLNPVIRQEFDDFIWDLKTNSAHFPYFFTYTDGNNYVIYRNWTYSTSKPKPFIIRNPQDMQFSTTSPFYYMGTGYISCNLDPNFSISFGIPQKIISCPSTLVFVDKSSVNNPGHIGIVPINTNVTQTTIQTRLDLIQVETAQ
jgi:hypothetical protein